MSVPAVRELDLVDGLVQVSGVIQAVLKALAEEYDASALQVRLLGVLRDRRSTMAELGRLMELDKSSTTGLVDRTEARGVVRRVPDGADGRVVRVELTPQGRRLVEASALAVAARIDTLASDLDAGQRDTLAGMLSALVRRYAQVKGIDLMAGTATGTAAGLGALPVTTGLRTFAKDGRVAVVIGSTRPGRICPGIARWVRDALAEGSPLTYELVDLADVDLPMLDEPLMAALHTYVHPHTEGWSRLVDGYGAFVFVFPQYNWGYPAVLKNALDFLYDEWTDKPASMVSYGTRGGNRGVAQLASVLQGLDMRPLDDHLEVKITQDDVDANWQLKDLGALMGPYQQQARTIDVQMTEALTLPSRTSSRLEGQ
jgi:NAD(P)H-dependent FMN reductase/DNA-binding MarR family transcriptional regulator